MLDCLDHGLNRSNEDASWGLRTGNTPSIVNTTEALRAYRELDAINASSLELHKDKLVLFLSEQLETELSQKSAATRKIAYGALGLHLLSNNRLETRAIEKLKQLANKSGGWPQGNGLGESLVVPTYLAMVTLQHLGEQIDDKHYDWLLSQRQADSYLSFSPSDPKTGFSPTALALYLLANSHYKDKKAVADLADAVRRRLPMIFERIVNGDREWAERDGQTGFRIYGYGHALAGLNLLQENLYSLRLGKFLDAITINCAVENDDAFSFNPQKTGIPAILELALALKSIRLNYDPFQYQKSERRQQIEDISVEIATEKERLAEQKQVMERYQTVFDEWEKELIRQRRLAYDISALKEEVSNTITQNLTKELAEISLAAAKHLRTSVLFYLGLLMCLSIFFGYVLFRLSAPGELGWQKSDGIVGVLSILIPLLGALINRFIRSGTLART
jgi:hypothetical protein